MIDLDGVYDPCRPNDRLLLGMRDDQRVRAGRAAHPYARRRPIQVAPRRAAISVLIGYVWHPDFGLGVDPDLRTQALIRLVFARFRELGSARQAHLRLYQDGVHFLRPLDGKSMVHFEWTRIRYRNVMAC